jgi:hypothetical protein
VLTVGEVVVAGADDATGEAEGAPGEAEGAPGEAEGAAPTCTHAVASRAIRVMDRLRGIGWTS